MFRLPTPHRRQIISRGNTGVPGLDREIEPSVSALQRTWIAIASILLMLHWAAPSVRPVEPIFQSSDSVPVFSSGQSASPAGTLPRHLPRVSTFESGFAKAGRSLSQTSGTLDALPQTLRFFGAPAAPAAAEPIVVALGAPQSAHDFQARAPPPAQA